MLLLALDTATPAITAALAEVSSPAGLQGGRVIARRVTVDGRAHSELLSAQVEAILGEAGVKPADLSAIVAGVGPGPFTGLRVGLVTAAMMGAALGIPTYGVCTLDTLGAATSGRMLVAINARRREVYWAIYEDGTRVEGPSVDKPADLAPVLASRGVLAAVGEGAARYADVLGVGAGEPHFPPVESLIGLAAQRVLEKAQSEQLTPLYLRRPDAMERKVP